jgi:hypothetical protein
VTGRSSSLASPPVAAGFQHQAERLIAHWELQAAWDGFERDGRYWETGWAWMLARRR